MKTTEERYNDSLERIDQTDALVGVAEEIKKITEALRKRELQKWTPDELSRALSSLAVLRVSLGEAMVDAIALYDFSYLNRKLRFASEWQPTKSELQARMNKVTNKDIDSTVMEKIADDQEQELANKHLGERMRIMYDATGTLITALQTRLNTLKSERIETKHY